MIVYSPSVSQNMCLGSWFQLNRAESKTESYDIVRTQGFLGIERGENSQERNKLELWLIWAYLYDTTDNTGEKYCSHLHCEPDIPLILNFLYTQWTPRVWNYYLWIKFWFVRQHGWTLETLKH